MGDDEMSESFWDVTGKHLVFGGCSENSDAVSATRCWRARLLSIQQYVYG